MRLTVREAAWRAHVRSVVAATPGLVPVVKGNGYGFGRATLARIAAGLADTIAVGTMHELDDLPTAPGDPDVVVLTPTLETPARDDAILTVGSAAHVAALRGWRGRVVVKLASSMRRYGVDAGDLAGLLDAAQRARLDVVGVAIHLPLAGTAAAHVDEVCRWLPAIDPAHPVWVSHLDGADVARLPATHRYRVRSGTALWHGDKSALHLDADVLDTRPVRAGDTAGYRLGPVPTDGTLVMVGAGTAHGVHPLPDGRSPFHHAGRRLALHEPPHMHTSMVLVPAGEPCPVVGDRVDVQRPLTTTLVDRIEWT